MDGVPGLGAGEIPPGGRTVYEFDALPAGLHLYHCHVRPLAEHIAKGLYGAFIVDPADGREEADEMVMVMNGFDTNFDRANEVYAANTIGFAYMDRPVAARRGELVRVYLVNVLEYDLINSFHLHGNLFHYFPTGTGKTPSELTDTVMLCQGQRGILEWRFPHAGRFMFHAHQSEFTELGWQGFFEVAMTASATRLRTPAWLLGLIPLALIVAAVGRLRRAGRRPGSATAAGRPRRSSRSSAPSSSRGRSRSRSATTGRTP